MLASTKKITNLWQRGLKAALLVVLMTSLSLGLSAAWWDGGNSSTTNRTSVLPQGNAITDGKALLRYALPIKNRAIREAQSSLEDIGQQLRGKRWSSITSDITKAAGIFTNREADILEDIPESQQANASAILDQIKEEIGTLRSIVEAEDKPATQDGRDRLLGLVGQLEKMMVAEFPYQVPAEYSHLPQLLGRATVAVETNKGNLTVVLDGYSAPVTSGNFVDLVQRGFYDGLEFIRSEDFYVLQTGDPVGPDQGFIDPDTGEYRNIPLEVLVRGDIQPTYGITLEEAGRFREQPVLPFSAFGTVAMARPEDDPDGGSSQFFFFLFEPELTPAGLNLLDGRYSVFGYVVEGKEILEKLKQGDQILSMKVVQGIENFVPAQAS
ncbi:peptidylprolyl isomerase [Oscillatoria acuminata]|uniref:peptidylprolyl isomerase n=1 Tax=Oscillatoria acuminata PCC 6304 TaxID=56110 RepID=K9TE00_9CYAN|nr:peptidylprolyl isomerase [Oscillatoria acuminata]AFY80346.1 peptidyl-prolyl cis-trans isomerase (rotamase) - cyclophilin family [Oscillatoria acuminata PCC 6304]